MSQNRSRRGIFSRLAAPFRRMAQRSAMESEAADDLENEIERARAAARERKGNSLTSEDFRLAMEQLLREDQGRFGTKLHVVSMVEFREAVGERWSKISDKVMMIAEGVITKHLGTGNLYARQGTDFFTLVFRTCGQDEGRIRAHTIAQELGTRLVGDQFQGVDRPLALSAEMALDDAILPDGTLNHPAVQRAVGEKRALIAGTTSDDRTKAWSPSLTGNAAEKRTGPDPLLSTEVRRKTQGQDGIPHAVTAKDKQQAQQDPGWVAMDRPKRMKESDTAWVILDTGSRPAQTQTVSSPAVLNTAPALPDSARLTLLWRPTWVSRPESIGAYVARIQRQDKPDAPVMDGSQAYPGDTEDGSIRTLDRYCIANALRDFRASENAGNGSTVILPIHWQTLTAENRMEYLAPFADITQQARNARVVIDLFGLPEQASARNVAETIGIARTLCREVVLRTRLSDSRAKLAADCGATMIGIDLSQLAVSERTDDASLVRALRHFNDQAAAFNLGTYVWGVRRRAAVVGAVQGGFAMVNGPALMKDIAKPAKVLPAPKARFAAMAG